MSDIPLSAVGVSVKEAASALKSLAVAFNEVGHTFARSEREMFELAQLLATEKEFQRKRVYKIVGWGLAGIALLVWSIAGHWDEIAPLLKAWVE